MGRNEVEEALAKWREAIRKRNAVSEGDRDALDAEVERAGYEFQRLSADYMAEQLAALRRAEEKRRTEEPSSEPYHDAARKEMRIASEIFGAAQLSDEEPRKN